MRLPLRHWVGLQSSEALTRAGHRSQDGALAWLLARGLSASPGLGFLYDVVAAFPQSDDQETKAEAATSSRTSPWKSYMITST